MLGGWKVWTKYGDNPKVGQGDSLHAALEDFYFRTDAQALRDHAEELKLKAEELHVEAHCLTGQAETMRRQAAALDAENQRNVEGKGGAGTLRDAVLAFLAARRPAAYSEPQILQQVCRSAAVQAGAPPVSIHDELTYLSAANVGRLVAPVFDDLGGGPRWTATEHGVSIWKDRGSLYIP